MQCHECRIIIPVYEARSESKIQDSIDTIESPFETGPEFVSTENRSIQMQKRKRKALTTRGVTKPRSKSFSQNQKIDPDISLEKGEVNIIYDSSV